MTMFKAKMTDTDEFIIGGVDMIHGILEIVYKCDSAAIADALEQLNPNNSVFVPVMGSDSWGFILSEHNN